MRDRWPVLLTSVTVLKNVPHEDTASGGITSASLMPRDGIVRQISPPIPGAPSEALGPEKSEGRTITFALEGMDPGGKGNAARRTTGGFAGGTRGGGAGGGWTFPPRLGEPGGNTAIVSAPGPERA